MGMSKHFPFVVYVNVRTPKNIFFSFKLKEDIVAEFSEEQGLGNILSFQNVGGNR